jgi:ABC-type branched-subunit amino acid transport system substrate-binding protein
VTSEALSPLRSRSIAALALALLLMLSGCTSGRFGSSPPRQTAQPVEQPTEPTVVPLPEGGVRVALLLPLSASGNAGAAAQSLKNAADLAQAEYKGSKLQISVKDDHGTVDGAREAATAAVAEGADVILGPLLAPAVQGAAQVVRPTGKPMIGFSTDASVAGRGVYLLSFMPENDVDRIIDFAAGRGKQSIAALIPNGAYGNVVAAAFQEACARRGVRIAALTRYDATTLDSAAREIAALTVPVDALFIPENGEGISALAQALTANGVGTGRLQMLGTGVWDDPRVLNNPMVQGGWFAAPERTGFSGFAQRYKARFGAEPVRIASLAYDAVFLINALTAQNGPQGLSSGALQGPEGIIGTDGLFRFRADGTAQRGLAVLQISSGNSSVIAAAPRSFGQISTQ